MQEKSFLRVTNLIERAHLVTEIKLKRSFARGPSWFTPVTSNSVKDGYWKAEPAYPTTNLSFNPKQLSGFLLGFKVDS